MRFLSRSAAAAASLAAVAVIVLPGTTAQADEFHSRLRDIAQETAQIMQEMQYHVRELQYRTSPGSGAADGQRVFMTQGRAALMELQRSAQRGADLGNDAYSLLSKCEKEVKKIGKDFQSQMRRIDSTVDRLMSIREGSEAESTLNQIEFSMHRANRVAGLVASITDCLPPEEAGGQQEGEEQQEKPQGKAEDYNDD
jgi:hypothetical protein